MVAVLVGDHVSLGERPALRAEGRPKIVEEADVEVDLAILRAIEGPLRAGCVAAARLSRAGEEHRARRVIGLPAAREFVAPVLLDAVDESDDSAVRTFVRVRAGLAVLHRRSAVDRLIWSRVVGEGIHAEEERGDEDEDADAAASDEDRSTNSAAAGVLYLTWIERCVASERHPAVARKARAMGHAAALGGGFPVGPRRGLGEEPRQRFGHRPYERHEVLVRYALTGEQRERRAERGALGLVADRTVLVLP